MKNLRHKVKHKDLVRHEGPTMNRNGSTVGRSQPRLASSSGEHMKHRLSGICPQGTLLSSDQHMPNTAQSWVELH